MAKILNVRAIKKDSNSSMSQEELMLKNKQHISDKKAEERIEELTTPDFKHDNSYKEYLPNPEISEKEKTAVTNNEKHKKHDKNKKHHENKKEEHAPKKTSEILEPEEEIEKVIDEVVEDEIEEEKNSGFIYIEYNQEIIEEHPDVYKPKEKRENKKEKPVEKKPEKETKKSEKKKPQNKKPDKKQQKNKKSENKHPVLLTVLFVILFIISLIAFFISSVFLSIAIKEQFFCVKTDAFLESVNYDIDGADKYCYLFVLKENEYERFTIDKTKEQIQIKSIDELKDVLTGKTVDKTPETMIKIYYDKSDTQRVIAAHYNFFLFAFSTIASLGLLSFFGWKSFRSNEKIRIKKHEKKINK